MQPTRPAWMLAFALGAAACGTRGEAAAALNPPVIDTLAGGVIHLRNTGPTRWTDTSGWRLVPVTTINPDDGTPGELGNITSMVIGDDGSVYVLQQLPVVIKVFGPDGTYLRSIGREGDGPGEFRTGTLGIRGDTLFVQDPGNQRLTFFLTDGTFLRTIPSLCCYYYPSITVDTAGRAWIPGSYRNSGGWLRVRMDGTIADTIPMPTLTGRGGVSKYWQVTVTSPGSKSKSSMIMNIPLQPYTLTAVRPDGMIVAGGTDAIDFAVLNPAGDTVRRFEAARDHIALSTADRDSILGAVVEKVSNQWRDAIRAQAKSSDLPDEWPAWSRQFFDRTGRMWLALPGARGEATLAEVFAPDGTLLGKVPPVDAALFDKGVWSRDRAAVATEDDNGRPVIRVYRVDTTLSPR